MDDVTASDLWIAEASGRRKTRLTFTPDRVELEPRFIGDRTLVLTVAAARGEEVGASKEVEVDVVGVAGGSGPRGKKGS
jgi:hypothetical protein